MPTKKPVLQSVVENDTYEKFLKIAEKERRSKSQLTKIAIENFIKKYEQEQGEIKIQNVNIKNNNGKIEVK